MSIFTHLVVTTSEKIPPPSLLRFNYPFAHTPERHNHCSNLGFSDTILGFYYLIIEFNNSILGFNDSILGFNYSILGFNVSNLGFNYSILEFMTQHARLRGTMLPETSDFPNVQVNFVSSS